MSPFPYHHVVLVGCSDGIDYHDSTPSRLCDFFKSSYNVTCTVAPSLFKTSDGRTSSASQRANDLMDTLCSPDIDAVFDITGGDCANAILPYLDFDMIKKHRCPFYGYSDVSVILNPLSTIGYPVYYFQARFLLESSRTRASFKATNFNRTKEYTPDDLIFLQGDTLSGNLCGGNIRCTLKLFGTPWQPDFSGKILFLESLSGKYRRIETYLNQYAQNGAFSACRGILLGNFTEFLTYEKPDTLYNLVLSYVNNPNIPIAATTQIGHNPDSLCLPYHHIFMHKA